MYKLENIKEIHLEVTSNCQARCPMCARRPLGGPVNPYISIDEVSLSQFKDWFNVDFIKNLNRLFMCGNLGDPIVAKDTLEIYQYIRDINSNIKLSMNTNGSARDAAWWKKLAGCQVDVVFGIDGLADTHHLYRVGTNYNTIISNAREFISAGGKASWHMLAFKHNEHQIDTCRELSQKFGFNNFEVKHTSRFKDTTSLPVLDHSGKTMYQIRPTQRSITLMKNVEKASLDMVHTISCKAKKYSQLYVAASGIVSPCCWLDVSWFATHHPSRINYMDNIGEFPNLNQQSLKDIFDSGYFDKIEKTWESNPLTECSKQCGNFDKFKEQFNEF